MMTQQVGFEPQQGVRSQDVGVEWLAQQVLLVGARLVSLFMERKLCPTAGQQIP